MCCRWAALCALDALMQRADLTAVLGLCVGYALSSIEGRVSVEYFDPSQEARRPTFAAKLNRARVQEMWAPAAHVSLFSLSQAQTRKYAFKCHRVFSGGTGAHPTAQPL